MQRAKQLEPTTEDWHALLPSSREAAATAALWYKYFHFVF